MAEKKRDTSRKKWKQTQKRKTTTAKKSDVESSAHSSQCNDKRIFGCTRTSLHTVSYHIGCVLSVRIFFTFFTFISRAPLPALAVVVMNFIALRSHKNISVALFLSLSFVFLLLFALCVILIQSQRQSEHVYLAIQ